MYIYVYVCTYIHNQIQSTFKIKNFTNLTNSIIILETEAAI